MAQMERNVNLEEIDADALFGIDALKGQSFLQKLIFFGCLSAGILINVCLPMFLNVPRAVCVLLFLLLLFVGIAFGCNYTQDLTYGKYLYCYFFKTAVTLIYESTEDVRVIRKNAEKIKKEEEAILLREHGKDPEEQRKLLVKLMAFIVVFAVTILSVVLFAMARKKENIHHEAVILETMEREEGNE